MFRQSTNQNHSQVFGSWVTSLDSINSWSIQMLLRGENDSKQSDEFQATTGSPMKWCMSNKHRIWVLLLLFGANFPQYDQSASATLIWVVTCYQYGISLPVSQTWFCRETSCGVAKCRYPATLYHHCFRWPAFFLSLIHIWRCRRSTLCRSRWSPYH